MRVIGQMVATLGSLFLGSTPHECIVESWINSLMEKGGLKAQQEH
jgi:hypothetical protein